jgi:hypothetical protein
MRIVAHGAVGGELCIRVRAARDRGVVAVGQLDFELILVVGDEGLRAQAVLDVATCNRACT